MRRFSQLAAASLLLATVAACAGPSATSAPTVAPSSAPAASAGASAAASEGASAVTIKDFAFHPSAVTVKVGSTITWTNQDSAGHTVTFDTGGVTSGTLATGATFSNTFATAGTFTYHCAIHSSMTGSVTVTS